ncbi:MAG: DUF885 domain-containing protein [Defluviitaleaceae bacterium]|nr:DUF885 domain-containing protein [Defluviitaleaceae bacterium]
MQNFRVLDKDIAELGQKLNGFIPTKENRQIAQGEIDALARRVKALDCNNPVLDVLAGHFLDFLESKQQALSNYYENPGVALQYLGWRLYSLCHTDYRPHEQRIPEIEAKIKSLPQLWNDAILPILPEKAQSVITGLKQAINTAKYTKHDLDEYRQSLESYLACASNFADEQKSTTRGDDEVIPVTPDEYRAALKNNIGVDLDQLLSWYEYENAKTRAESLELANKIKGPIRSTAEVSDLLFKYAGPCDSAEEMFSRANEYLKRARAAAHQYIWLPHDEQCECIPIPPQLKDSYPWGGYNSDYPSRYPLYNTMFLNNFNYTAITDGWIKINALHEAYPGHHAQFIRAAIDPIPETMKRGAKSIPLSEGTCIRTERVFEFVFAEDPYYPLMVAHRRHHTSTRIKIDLMLHYFGKTIGEACDLYQQEMGFDRKTARAQVQAHENGMGYFTSYYYGMKKIYDWEKEYYWDKRDYTDLLFSVGRVSLETFEKILKLTSKERHSLTHDFASLIQFR